MITLLLHLLPLLPVLFGSHRQLALENPALRQQLAVYKRMMNPAPTTQNGPPLLGLPGQNPGRVEAAPRHREP